MTRGLRSQRSPMQREFDRRPLLSHRAAERAVWPVGLLALFLSIVAVAIAAFLTRG